MSKKYILYLDESGSFIDDSLEKGPSLIGGYLVSKDSNFSLEKASKIYQEHLKNIKVDGKQIYHFADISQKLHDSKLAASKSIDILDDLRSKAPCQFVLFINNEKLKIDYALLYLNIFAEGISNLIEKLSIEDRDDLVLDINIASRQISPENKNQNIELEEYENRLKEKIYMQIAEKNIFLARSYSINLHIQKAGANPYIDLADVVCNSYHDLSYKNGKSRYKSEQKEILRNFLNHNRYVFNVFKSDLQKTFADYLQKEDYADAILLVNDIQDEEEKARLKDDIIKNINGMIKRQEYDTLSIEFETLSLKLKNMIEVHKNLDYAERILLYLEDGIFPRIKGKDFAIIKLKIDISLYLLRIYTYKGAIDESKKQLEICRTLLKDISGAFEFAKYYNEFKVREAIHYLNMYDNLMAICSLTDAIDKFNKIVISFSDFGTKKSRELGKLYGTILQAYTNMLTWNLEENKKEIYYIQGKECSDMAEKLFLSKRDKEKEYHYRALLEIAIGNIKEAIIYLFKICEINHDINSIQKLTKEDFDIFLIEVSELQESNLYDVMLVYFTIIDYLDNFKINNKDDAYRYKELAKTMFNSYLSNNRIYKLFNLIDDENSEKLEKISDAKDIDPVEFIYWLIAKHYASEKDFLSISYFNSAIKICDKLDEPTFNLIKIAIMADKLYYSKDIVNSKLELVEFYYSIRNIEEYREIFDCLNTFFKNELDVHVSLDELVENLELVDDERELRKFCRLISNNIKC